MDTTELDSEVLTLMHDNDETGTVAWTLEVLEVSEEEVLASFERLVAAGEIEPGNDWTDRAGVTHATWKVSHPPPDDFILAVAKAVQRNLSKPWSR